MIPFNEEVVMDIFKQYPKIFAFVTAGTISLKAARMILDIDKDTMYNVYLELIQAGAIVGVGYNCFRASDDLKKWIVTLQNENFLRIF